MGTSSTLFIKNMANSEIFVTRKLEKRFSQQDEIKKLNSNGEETKFQE